MASLALQCALGGVSLASSRGVWCSAASSIGASPPSAQRLVPCTSPTPRSKARPAQHSQCCRAAAPEQVPATQKVSSILCQNCEGNGAVVCSQCKGKGLNAEDHFGGRFKAGNICWLCRGKKEMLCGNCNGAGFMGGFLNTQDD